MLKLLLSNQVLINLREKKSPSNFKKYFFFKETLASDAGLKKGDLVVKINNTFTENLPNEELRKIMRERIKSNSIDLITLSKQLEEQCKHFFI